MNFIQVNLTALLIILLFQNKIFASEIEIKNIWVRDAIHSVAITSLYFTIKNNTGETRFLTKIDSEKIGYLGIKKTIIENNIARIIDIKKVAIPPFSQVEFKPGEIFLMLADFAEIKGAIFHFYFEDGKIISKEAS